MTAITQRRAGIILRQRLSAEVLGLPIIWAVFVLGVALLVGAVAVVRAGGIEVSGWEQAAQFARWYVGAVGAFLIAVYLPLYVTHGFTRREFALQLPVFLVAFVAGFAALMTLGFAVETVAYRTFGWSQALTGTHLFDTPTQYPLIFTEFVLVGLAWTVAGAVLGGAFYRNAFLGLLLIPVALAMVGLVEATAGPRYFGPIPTGGLTWLGLSPPQAGISPGAAALAALGVFVVGIALVWVLIRDVPVRSKT